MKKNCFARFAAAALSLAMLAGCGASQSSDSAAVDTGSADSAELTVFAAASMTETLNQIAEDYKAVDPNVTLTFNFASSGDLLTPDQGRRGLRRIHLRSAQADERAGRLAHRGHRQEPGRSV